MYKRQDPEIVKAHQEGLIHFHDSDYFAHHMHNCDLVNLEDMLQNGTVISGTYIEKPHSFSTACNIATQIIAQVASNQYGGQSISLTHLAPFVDVSRKKIAAEVEVEMAGLDVSAERKKEIVERRLRSEINRGVQTIQYQVVTLMTTNGQAPFITVFMYLGEARNPQEKADLAIIIEETIRQRYQGVKNEAGVWITPAFPKLISVLEEDNIRPEMCIRDSSKAVRISLQSSILSSTARIFATRSPQNVINKAGSVSYTHLSRARNFLERWVLHTTAPTSSRMPRMLCTVCTSGSFPRSAGAA